MDRRGFTLIEIAVVLAIIGMVMLLVIPRLPKSEQENLKISARTMAATMRYVQERAAATRTNYSMILNPGTESTMIQERSGDGGLKTPTDPLLQKLMVKEGIQVTDVMIPRLGVMTDGQVQLDIGMGGLRDFAVIHLKAPGGTFWTVMAFPAGGKVKAYDGYLEGPP